MTTYTPFTRSNKRRADIEQTSSKHQAKYEACIKHSLHEANIKQISSQLVESASSCKRCTTVHKITHSIRYPINLTACETRMLLTSRAENCFDSSFRTQHRHA